MNRQFILRQVQVRSKRYYFASYKCSNDDNKEMWSRVMDHRLSVWNNISKSDEAIYKAFDNEKSGHDFELKLVKDTSNEELVEVLINPHHLKIPLGQLLKSDKKSKNWFMLQDACKPSSSSSSLHPNSILSNGTQFYIKSLKSKKTQLLPPIVWNSSSFLLSHALENVYQGRILSTDRKASDTERSLHVDLLLKEGLTPIIYDLMEHNLQNKPTRFNLEAQIETLFTKSGPQIHIKEDQFQNIHGQYMSLCDQALSIEKKMATMDEAMQLFAYNPFKLFKLKFMSRNRSHVSLYRCGSSIDFDDGMHVLNTRFLKHSTILSTNTVNSLELSSVSSSQKEKRLDRLYAIAFPTSSSFETWQQEQERLKQLDHRVIGKTQELFFMHPTSPGSIFFLPHGMRIYQKLMDMVKKEYKRNGYHEIATPILFDKELWVTSGHWENYQNDMFVLNDDVPKDIELEKMEDKDGCRNSPIYGLKPMNCPGHCLMYQSKSHSYRDLPVRYAEFGALHRNEASGALTGLTRVRKFHQDDAHIFCTPFQMKQEISSTLNMIERLYRKFGFKSYEMALSTRPEQDYIGNLESWNQAEKILTECLQEHVSQSHSFGSIQSNFKIKYGDGAFYGPKIDVMVKDSIGRSHQLGTVQLDFNLPKRFQLTYQKQDGTFDTPVMIHRAALGSLERMMAILTEHHEGKWPFWLSPRQILVIPISSTVHEYAHQLHDILTGVAPLPQNLSLKKEHHYLEGYHADLDVSDHTITKKIRDAFWKGYNVVVVVGERERESFSVNVRKRGEKQGETIPFNLFLQQLEIWNHPDHEARL